MRLIKEEKFNREIKQSFIFKFVVDREGLYLLEITASAKSWWQKLKSLRSFFKDDDLFLELDGEEILTTIVGKLDARALFNGNELKGCSKTVVIAKYLNKGEHVIDFASDKTPFLKSVKIIDSEAEDKITYIPADNNLTKSSDRMPWISYVLLNLTAKKISIGAIADKKDRDDDDIKLCIDRVVEKNLDKKSHKDWYWCGKILKGKERKFTKDVNLESGIHFVDLWADGQPKLTAIEIILDRGDNLPILKNKIGHIRLYKDIEVVDYVTVRSAAIKPKANEEDNKIMQLTDGDQVEIIEELVKGTYITNESEIWHKIKYQNVVGYVLSTFVEIDGQSREQIIEKIKEEALAQGVDADYAIALAGCESRFKPYAKSDTGALGIYQLTQIARDHLSESLNYQISADTSYDFKKNIKAGIIYLKWLFNIYKDEPDRYKKITAAWNAGHSKIPVSGSVNYSKIIDTIRQKEVKNLVECVEKNRKNKSWKGLMLLSVVILITGVVVLNSLKSAATPVFADKELRYSDASFQFNSPYPGIKSIKVSSYSPEMTVWETAIEIESDRGVEVKKYPGLLLNAYLFDALAFTPMLFIEREDARYLSTAVLFYDDKEKGMREAIFTDFDGRESNEICCSKVIFTPIDESMYAYDLSVWNYDGKARRIYSYDYTVKNYFEKREINKVKKYDR